MNKILITIIFILFTNTALSNTFDPPPKIACTNYLQEIGLKEGVNRREYSDGTSKKPLIVGIGETYLSRYERDKKGKILEFKLPTDEAVLNSQMEAFRQSLSSLLRLKGIKTRNIPEDKNLVDIDVKIRAIKTIFNQDQFKTVCSVIVIIPNN